MKNKEQVLKYSVGVDISKADFKVCFSKIFSTQVVKVVGTRSFNNTHNGFLAFEKWLQSKQKDRLIPLIIVIEATGVYYELLAFYLQEKGYSISVVVPSKSKKYLEYIGLKSKNDKIDAKGLAQMGAEQQLKLWKPSTKFYYELRMLTRHQQSLKEQQTRIINRLEAMKHSANYSNFVLKSLRKQLKQLEREVGHTIKAIEKHIASDEQIAKKVAGICKVKGLNILSVATILAETLGFELFENYRQLISYAGYDVVENQSGKREGKTRISKKGNSRIRRILLMPAFVCVKYEQTVFYNLFKRTFAKHGIKLKSYVAVQKKLLVIIFALWKNNTDYDNEYHIKNIQRNGVGVCLSGSVSEADRLVKK